MAKDTKQPRSLIRLLLKVLGVIAGVAVLVISYQEYSKMSRIRKAGAVAVVEPVTSYSERRKKGSTTYSATFNFKTTDGRRITQNHSFNSDVLTDLKSNTPVRVLYDPQNPNEFIFEKQTFSMWIFAVGAGLIVAALFFL